MGILCSCVLELVQLLFSCLEGLSSVLPGGQGPCCPARDDNPEPDKPVASSGPFTVQGGDPGSSPGRWPRALWPVQNRALFLPIFFTRFLPSFIFASALFLLKCSYLILLTCKPYHLTSLFKMVPGPPHPKGKAQGPPASEGLACWDTAPWALSR